MNMTSSSRPSKTTAIISPDLVNAYVHAACGKFLTNTGLEAIPELIKQGNYQQAAKLLHNELYGDPDNGGIMFLLGISYR